MPRFLFAISGHVEAVAKTREEAAAMLKQAYINVNNNVCVYAVPLQNQLIHQEKAESEA